MFANGAKIKLQEKITDPLFFKALFYGGAFSWTESIHILYNVRMENPLSAKIYDFFTQHPQKEYGKGQLIIAPDTSPNGVYCLTEGIVRCYGLSKDGIELTLNIFKPTSFFPMSWVMNGKQDRYYYEALSEVNTFCASKEDFEKFIQTEHEVAYDLLRRIYRGLDGYMMRMESLLSGDAYLRTITNILIHALRFGEINDNKPVELRLTHIQIASQSGLSRETVTREVKKLQMKGIVSYKGETLLIHDTHKLEHEVLE